MRKLSVGLYAGAFLLSLVIFISGIFVGQLIDMSSMETLQSEVSSVSQKVASVQLLFLMEGNSSSFCPVYSSELDSIDAEVERVGHKLTYLEDEKNIFDPELKKQYFVLQAESYLLSSKVREMCDGSSILLIHFYSNKDCDDCRQQGVEILRARDELSGTKLKLYSFDGELGSPVADAFMQKYNISTYPSIVIDGKTYPGYHSSSEIRQLIE
jgi:hypothetical protein